MTKRSAPDNAAHGRTIGEILLAYGYIDEDRLTEATEIQKRTGQPLGQLLVEAGTITRLELATALAEQWSDTPLPSREEAAKNRAARGIDDSNGAGGDSVSLVSAAALAAVDQQLAGWRNVSHLQSERLDELEARIGALGDGEEDEPEALTELRSLGTELAQRISDLVDDVADLRARAVASDQLQPVLQELGERVEEALARPVGDPDALGALTSRVEELSARPLVDEGLQAAVRELSERPPGDVEVAARVRALEEQAGALAALAATVDELVARPLVDESLQAAVRELSERPTGAAEVTARVVAIEEQLSALARLAHVDPAALEALRATVDELAARPLVDEGLQAAVRELSERPAGDVEVAARVRSLEEQLAELAARPAPEQDTAALDELTVRLAALAERPAGDPELLGSLITRIEELAERPVADVTALEAVSTTIDRLSARVDELAGTPIEDALVRDAVRELASRFDELAAGLDELTARPVGDPVVAARVEDLAAETEERVSAFAALEQRVQELADAVAARSGTANDDVAREELAALRALVESAASDRPAVAVEGVEQLVERLETLERVAGELAAAPVPTPAPVAKTKGDAPNMKELEQLRVVVDSMRMRSAEQEKAVAALIGPKGLGTKLEQLITRVEALESTGPVVVPTGEGGEASSVEASALQHDLRAVAKRVEDAQESMQAERDKLFQRLERMASSIDWRLQRLEKPGENAEAA